MARRVKRQVNQEDIRKALCKAASIGEFFRLTTMIMTGVLSEFCIPKDLISVLRLVLGSNNCRDVVACTKDGLRVSFFYPSQSLIGAFFGRYSTSPAGSPVSSWSGILSSEADLRLAKCCHRLSS